jgi:hypothetical protein
MHCYSDLIYRCSAFTLENLHQANEKTIEALQESGSTILVKTIQMIQLQKVIHVIGIFAMFEAILQDELECINGFVDAKMILQKQNESELCENFIDMELAINVLKHGQGRSYKTLISRNGGTLRRYIKELNDDLFREGDIANIQTLIEVDDDFVIQCSNTIYEVAEAIKKTKPFANI